MPDWITHLGIAYILGKLIKIKNIKLLLLGAVLPDIITRLTYFFRLFNINEITLAALFEPFHSGLFVALTALSIALLNKKPKATFLILIFGSFIHILLDLIVSPFGYPRLLLYPFSFKTFSIDLFPHESIFGISLIIISLIALILAIFDKNIINTRFKIKNLYYIIPILIIMITMPILTFNAFPDKVDYIAQFEKNKDELNFAYSKITSENPIKIISLGKEYVVDTNPISENIKFKKDDVISMKAKLINKKLKPYFIFKHNKYFMVHLSILGLLFFIIIWINPIKRWKKTY